MPPKRKPKKKAAAPAQTAPFAPSILGQYPALFPECKTHAEQRDLQKRVVAEENGFRELFAQDRENALLADPHLMLIPVHEHREALFRYQELTEEEKAIPTVFGAEASRVPGTLAVEDAATFERNFTDIFTEGQLRFLNWDNVFACGGAVLASLVPPEGEHGASNKAKRNYYHNVAYGSADVDLFIYGLNAEQANEKLKEIYFAVTEANPYEVVCFRSQHAVTIVSQYPFRHIQIILRLYKSPAEVLMGFDVDSCSVGYDGQRVWMTPRCHRALVFQANTVDMSRRSPSYEQRLAKYSERGFAVQVPTLDRTKVDPQLFERRFDQLQGLSRLLLLERLGTPEKRTRYKDLMRLLKMRPVLESRGYFGSRKHVDSDRLISGSSASDYSALYLPWGEQWTAKRLRKLMYTKDVLLNSEHFDPNKKHHTHPCFFGTAEEVLGDCCGSCPEVPVELQDPDAPYVSGTLSWLEVNPGAQAQIGSFHPITEGDWTAGAYVLESAWQLSFAVNNNDVSAVSALLAQPDVDVNARDSLGRTPLHIAAYSNSVEAAQLLLQAGARVASVTPEGRNALLICAMYGHVQLLSLLLERGRQLRDEQAQPMELDEEDEEQEEEEEEEEDEDDEGDFEGIRAIIERKKKEEKKELEAGDAFLRLDQKPDTLDLTAADYDFRMSALHVALFFGHVEVVKLLLDAEAPLSVLDMMFEGPNVTTYPPLHLAVLGGHLEMVRFLLARDASVVNVLNGQRRTALHLAVMQRHLPIVRALCEQPDTTVDAFDQNNVTPLLMAIYRATVKAPGTPEEDPVDDRSYEIIEYLLNGANASAEYLEGVFPSQASAAGGFGRKRRARGANSDEPEKSPEVEARDTLRSSVKQPIIIAVKKGSTRLVELLLESGADADWVNSYHQTAQDLVSAQLEGLKAVAPRGPAYDEVEVTAKQLSRAKAGSWQQYVLQRYLTEQLGGKATLEEYRAGLAEAEATRVRTLERWQSMQSVLKAAGAKPFLSLKFKGVDVTLVAVQKEVRAGKVTQGKRSYRSQRNLQATEPLGDVDFQHSSIPEPVPGTWVGYGEGAGDAQNKLYHKLFEAVFRGDIKTIDAMTVKKPVDDQLHIAVTSALTLCNPLHVAAMRGHGDALVRLVQVATEQFTPLPRPEAPAGGAPRPVMNNYDLVAMMREMRQGGTLPRAIDRGVAAADPNAEPLQVNCTVSPKTILMHKDRKTGFNVLHWLAFAGHEEATGALLAFLSATAVAENDYSDVDPTCKPPTPGSLIAPLLKERDSRRLTPFEVAIARGNTAVAAHFLRAAGVQGVAGQDAPQDATEYKGLDVAGKKMTWAMEATGQRRPRSRFQRAAVHVAALANSGESVRWLHEEAGAIAAQVAQEEQSEDDADFLDVAAITETGDSALHYAAATLSQDAAAMLIRLVPSLTNQPGHAGATPLHVVARHSTAPEAIPFARLLLDASADPTATQEHGWTPLHVAASIASEGAAMTTLLARQNAAIDAQTATYGQTALMLATQGVATHDNVRALLAAGASTMPRSTAGDYALHAAIKNDNQPAVESIIAGKHGETGENGAGLTPLDYSMLSIGNVIGQKPNMWKVRRGDHDPSIPESKLVISDEVKKTMGTTRSLVSPAERRAVTDLLLTQLNDAATAQVRTSHNVEEVVPQRVTSIQFPKALE